MSKVILGMGILLLAVIVSVGVICLLQGKGKGSAGSKENDGENRKTVVVDAEGDDYLVIQINDATYDLSEKHTKTAHAMLKDKILLMDGMRFTCAAWDEEESEVKYLNVMDLRATSNYGSVAVDSSEPDPGTHSEMDVYKEHAIILRGADQAGVVRNGKREGQKLFRYRYDITSRMNKDFSLIPRGKLSFCTSNGIQEDSTWEDITKIEHGWESKGIHLLMSSSNLNSAFVPTSRDDQRLLHTYTILYEDKMPIDTKAEQYESELRQYAKEGKTLNQYLLDKEWYNMLSAMSGGPEDYLDLESYIGEEKKYELSALVLDFVYHEALERLYNGETDELAIVQYQMIDGIGGVSSYLPRSQIGVSVLVYSTEAPERL